MISEFLKKLLISRGVKFDDGELKLMGMNLVTFYVSIAADLWLRMKSKKNKKILYEVGFRGGWNIMKFFSKYIPKSAMKKMIDLGLKFSDVAGWGKFEVVKFDEKEGNVVVRNWNTVAKYIFLTYGKQKSPACDFMRGVVGGSFAFILGKGIKDVEVKETCCISMGHNYCQFEIKVKGTSHGNRLGQAG